MRFWVCSGVFLTLALGLSLSPCLAQEKTTASEGPPQDLRPPVVVKEFKGPAFSDAERATLTELLCTRLLTHNTMNVICTNEAQMLLEKAEQGFLLGTCDSDECYAKIEKLIKSPFLITGNLGKIGKETVVTLTLVSCRAPGILKRIVYTIPANMRLIEGVREAADRLAK